MTVLAKKDGDHLFVNNGAGPGQPLEVDVNWRIVKSTNVYAVGWDSAGNMYVKFGETWNGRLYAYPGVSRQRAVSLAHAPSVGKRMARLKKQFPAVRLA